jgi:hypothetical protein
VPSRDLVEEYEEWKRLEAFAERQAAKAPEPEPEPVDPHKTYTQGPAGQTITDWKAFAGSPTPEQLEIHSTVEDRRDNRDPEAVWAEISAQRNGKGNWVPFDSMPDEHIGQLSFDDTGLDAA